MQIEQPWVLDIRNRLMGRAASLLWFCKLLLPMLLITSEAKGQEALASPSPKLTLAISEFHALWQTAWQWSEDIRRSSYDAQVIQDRRRHLHCHSEQFLNPASRMAEAFRVVFGSSDSHYPMIKGATTGFAVCPSWLLSHSTADAESEERWRDGALAQRFRTDIQDARRRLLDILDDALQQNSQNGWILGQLVRFHIDANALDRAMDVATQCRNLGWWCSGLTGLVQDRQGNIPGADSAFAVMRTQMSDSLRCRWEDVQSMLSEQARQEYVQMDCAGKDSINERVWWLADPLFAVQGNARLVEQEVRRMEIALRQATIQDERLRLDVGRGGDAVAEVIQRYGWPTYMSWMGKYDDRSHDGYLVPHHRTPPSPPYTTFEYSLNRIRTTPEWSAVKDPFAATSGMWQLAQEDSSGRVLGTWWPQEHFRPERRLVQLSDGQVVRLRRHSLTEIAAAIVLDHPQVSKQETYSVMLVASTGPSQVSYVGATDVVGGDVAFIRGPVPSQQLLLGIEARSNTQNGIDGRTRYGVKMHPPLSALSDKEISLSDIALLSPLPSEALMNPNDTMLSGMLGENSISSTDPRVTLYWESYGTSPGDSASFAIRVASKGSVSLARKIGIVAGIVSDPSTSVEVRWKDHERHGGLTTLAGPVPVQMRAITLDLHQLKPGDYVVEVTAQLADGRTATTSTTIRRK